MCSFFSGDGTAFVPLTIRGGGDAMSSGGRLCIIIGGDSGDFGEDSEENSDLEESLSIVVVGEAECMAMCSGVALLFH